MTRLLPRITALLFVLLSPRAIHAESSTNENELVVARLTAFGRLYGYVRFFHPSDAAASADWARVAVEGARLVRLTPESSSLVEPLNGIFGPLTVGLRLGTEVVADNAASYQNARPARFTHWQYSGLSLEGQGQLQRRVISDVISGPRAQMFESGVQWDQTVSGRLADGTWFLLPVALPVDSEDKTPSPSASNLSGGEQVPVYDVRDPDVRIAGVVITWNVLQHFFPYWGDVREDWPSHLPIFIAKALSADTPETYYDVLSELIAITRDGHGYVYGRPDSYGGAPILVEKIEGRILVTAAAADSPIRKRDVILNIDGVDSHRVLEQRLRVTSGSDQLREFRALNQYGRGPLGAEVSWSVLRDGREQGVRFRLGKDERGYFWNVLSAYSHPAIFEPKPGIFYVNLLSCPKSEFAKWLPELQSAKAIIFDWRHIGDYSPEDDQINVLTDILPHLTSEALPAPPIYLSSIALPDGHHSQGRPVQWKIEPAAPKIAGRAVFITIPGVVSYGETCMALVVHHRLAQTVGEATAGCNGGVSFIPLPGGPRVMWTQMKVTKHDGSRLYLDGYKPDYPVTRTIKSVLAGKDEYLEKALEVLGHN